MKGMRFFSTPKAVLIKFILLCLEGGKTAFTSFKLNIHAKNKTPVNNNRRGL
jgi:hypothetical protein